MDLMGQIDVILDMAAGDLAQFNLDALAIDGRIACIGFMRGSQCELDLIQLLMKRATLTGSTLRRLTENEKAQCFTAISAKVMPDVESGAIRPIIDKIFPLKMRLKRKSIWRLALMRAKFCWIAAVKLVIGSGP